jgi:hypothetical protein
MLVVPWHILTSQHINNHTSSALNYKDKSLSFYPVIYIETGFQKLVAKEYGKFISGIILASAWSGPLVLGTLSPLFDRYS